MFSSLFKKKKKNEALTTVFRIAKENMYNFDYPISEAGRFELFMYDVWLGTRILEDKNIPLDFNSMFDQINNCLKDVIKELKLPSQKKYENIYMFREEGWEIDLMGLMHSDYPRTKQYLPAYLYLCIIDKPLLVFDEENTKKQIEKIPFDKLADFLGPFCEHHSLIVKNIISNI